MRDTKLILIEGISGSGKSTLAQFITQTLDRQHRDCQWWYEEEKEHPLHVFHDHLSLQQTIDALADGRHQQIIEAVLRQWTNFVQARQKLQSIAIFDGSLFGYLTWSLFPLDIPEEEIRAYLAQVEQIIRPLQPCLIYLYQQDLVKALEKICLRRGGNTHSWLLAQATQSPYGERRGLQGFAGIVSYWQDFRVLIEKVFSQFSVSKFALENGAGDWPTYERSVIDFLGFAVEEKISFTSSFLRGFVGTYTFEENGERQTCFILLENESLLVDGMVQVWPRTRLIPLSDHTFAIESLPFLITFEADVDDVIVRMRVTGPELLFGTVASLFMREQK